jgi:methylenetetrahydrofolate dehydrogenase (NADP+)/methenyltetrahydrofolate cyclohydrolase
MHKNHVVMDGKALADRYKAEVAEQVKELKFTPCLAIIQVGHDPASDRYVKWKIKDCDEVGIKAEHIQFEDSADTSDILLQISALNSMYDVRGIIVQLPLPAHIDQRRVLDEIAPWKDVDGLTVTNTGKLAQRRADNNMLMPCTPLGIMMLLEEYYPASLQGTDVVIIGRSNLVGKPLAQMLLAQDATVTICHSHTRNLERYIGNADIVISAAGEPGVITDEMLHAGQCVIDVGTTMGDDGKLHGDLVGYEKLLDRWMYVTPVPGGVGPMTRAMLLANLMETFDCF